MELLALSKFKGERMKRKIASLFSALLISLGIAISPVMTMTPATAAPVQVCETTLALDNTVTSKTCKTVTQQMNRWGYCTVTPATSKLTLYDLQGYCGDSVKLDLGPDNYCRLLPSAWNNWAGSGVNYTTDDVLLYDTFCDTAPPNSAGWIPWASSHPNFYAMFNGINVGNKVSYILFIWA